MTPNLNSEDSALRKSDAYWLNQFSGELPLLDFPTDKIFSSEKSNEKKVLKRFLDQNLIYDFKKLLLSHQTQLLPGLLAIANILLFKYTGQEDIIIGSQIPRPEISDFGKKIQNIAVRSKFKGSENYKELLVSISRRLEEAKEQNYLSLENLIGKLDLKNEQNRNPLFDLMVQLENHEMEQNPARYEDLYNNLYLLFTFNDKVNGLELSIRYSNDLFFEDSISRFFNHFENLIRSILDNPLQSINSLTYLSTSETNQLIFDFNGPEATYPSTKTIVDLFEEQVIAHPSHIAITFNSEQITYSDLNERSNQLARYLIKKGVCKDFLIPICIERSVEMLIGILGISKAGGAYVPIDPDYPADRIQFLLKDTSAKIVVSSNDSSSVLKDFENIDIIKIDTDWNIIGKEIADNLNLNIHPGDLAYVIYTSGSTGTPKGVLIEHRNIVRLFKTDRPLFDFTDKDVWTMFHSFSFDFSVWEMYGAFFYGGRLVIVPKQVTKDLSLYADLLIKEHVTILNQTPSAFYVLQDFLIEYRNMTPMRYIIFGGEALNPAKLKPWHSLFPQSKLINMYGITETTVHVSYQEIEKKHIDSGRSMIGKPIPTLRLFILDSKLSLLPIGIPGEICIGGSGLARGYLNRPELTEERFINYAFKNTTDIKLYRSGDLGKRLPDGNIEYLGRIDNQVKIRGYRIELGEIENVIQQFPGIETAVVLVKGDNSAERQLIAFMVSKSQLNFSELGEYLITKLPEYMIPALFKQTSEIPLTPNGKIDSKALLTSITNPESPTFSKPGIQSDNENSLSNKVRQIFLDVSRIDINETDLNMNFVRMGLNSLLLTQIAHLIKKEFGLSIGYRQLNDTISTPALLINFLTSGIKYGNNPLKSNTDSYMKSDSYHNDITHKYKSKDIKTPPVPGARLGRDQNGNPAWFILNPDQPGKYMQIFID